MTTRTHISKDEFDESLFTAGPDVETLPKRIVNVDTAKGDKMLGFIEQSPTKTLSINKAYSTKEEAERVGKSYQRIVNAALTRQKREGESARLTVMSNGSDAYIFVVSLGIAREGKGTKRGPRKPKVENPLGERPIKTPNATK